MKREFLAGLGLSNKIIDKVMTEYGKTVQETQSKLKTVEEELQAKTTDLESANKTITELQKSNSENADLQQQIKDYQQKLADAESKRNADRKEAFIELGLTKAGVRNSKAAKALLDLEKITESDNGFDGFDEQLKALQESDAYLFQIAEDKPEPTPQITTTGNPVIDTTDSDPFQAIIDSYK